jgi:hypothetical protein
MMRPFRSSGRRFLGKILRRLRAFGIIFDFANAPLGEVHGHNEQHARSPMGLLCHFSGREHQSKRVKLQGGAIGTICHLAVDP